MSTGAHVGGVRPPGIPRESWLRRKTIKSEAARRVREVTDNRTNEPTPEQVEAAAKALRADEGFMAEVHSALEVSWSEYIARLVLVAAQDIAPQDNGKCGGCHDLGPHRNVPGCQYYEAPVLPSSTTPQAEAYDHCCQHPKCPGGSLCCCASEQRLRDCWNQWREEIAGDSRQAFRDGYQAGQNDPAPWLTARVLPSSGVDEDKLAEVIANARNRWAIYGRKDELLEQYVARAVAEWLKGRRG